ncbi:hypothetical protein [Labrys okinawensis]|nr:hypothetical protein [Labrys okinawensis]
MRPSLFAAMSILTALPLSPAAQAGSEGLESREYKVGLDPAALPGDSDAAILAVEERLSQVTKLEFGQPKQMQVQFFDTQECALTRASMLLRSREKPGKTPRITLKIRNTDMLAVKTMPIGLSRTGETAFQDDYGIGPTGKPSSDFSKSFSFDDTPPKTLSELAQSIHNLHEIVPFQGNSVLQAGPRVAQTAYASEPLPMSAKRKIRLEATLWYPADGGKPLAGDVSFTLEAPFDYGELRAADKLLLDLAKQLGPLKGSSAEKALAVIPESCR